ncbi:MAG TPA: SGNH/GDSL hydrolase family protein [Thermodesulfobacteriota bacterium]|nr:SGNH/GDSL hydrolase family protein [Thermodesulfobacteriota bacterium]
MTSAGTVRTPRAAVGTAALIALLALPPAPPALAGAFTDVVVFGDSLSDPGNHFVAFGTVSTPPFQPIPEGAYAIGGHRFSNGATWAEQLATALGRPTGGKPALRAPGVFTNYAVGGARARPAAPAFPHFDLGTQVNLFLADAAGRVSATELIVIWIGTNDLRDALEALADDPSGTASGAILRAAIAAVADSVQALWQAGARVFLVPDAPNPAHTPAVRALGAAVQGAATLLTALYNGQLRVALAALEALPGTRIVRLDVNALFADVLAAPQAAGLVNVTDPCLRFGVTGGAICATPNRFLFWDALHPTRTGHALVAAAALQALLAR